MNEVVAGVLRWVLRIVLVAMGLVMFLSLLAAALVLALVWSLRALWARITGRPLATPWSAWMTRVDPRTGFRTVYRSADRWSAAPGPRGNGGAADEPAPSRRGGVLPGTAEVTDVQAREVRE
ncbi:MAG TPA: hypothetical protein PLE22_08550 [Acidovorax sp.]|nr:hypothetical protein [Acidovorax sp.]